MTSNNEKYKILKAKLNNLYIEQNAVEESLNKMDSKERTFSWYAQSIYGGGILIGVLSVIASTLTSGLSLILTGAMTLICGGIRVYQNILYKRVQVLESQLADLKNEKMYADYQFKKLNDTQKHVSFRVEKHNVIHSTDLRALKASKNNDDIMDK